MPRKIVPRNLGDEIYDLFDSSAWQMEVSWRWVLSYINCNLFCYYYFNNQGNLLFLPDKQAIFFSYYINKSCI